MKTRFAVVSLVAAAACASPAKEDAKGQVDESAPPSTPMQLGKADGSSKTVAVDVQSAHPYTNNLNRTYDVPLTDLPSCAQNARLHFKVLRTEANYDFVEVLDTGEEFDGSHDDTWTEWFPITSAAARVRLSTDYSITRHGFEIDLVEWDGVPAGCPTVSQSCGAGNVNLAPAAGTCECPVAAQCEAIANVEVSHQLYRGFNNTTKRAQGSVATYTHPGPADGPETDTIGSVDPTRLAALVRRAAVQGLLHNPGYSRPIDFASGDFAEVFTIVAGPYQVSFTAMQGEQDPNVQNFINDFEALFTCGDGGLTCGNGYTCDLGTCVPEVSCVCPAVYAPVCSTDGVTFSNACAAGCANVAVAHDGECGIAGDTCGTFRGLSCVDDHKCRFASGVFDNYPYPDAGGTCVELNYCDAPVDCNGLPHIAVPGAWACTNNTCSWQSASAWQTLGNFSTTNPYSNNMSVWAEAYLPNGSQAMRLSTLRFATELNYDKLEVWTWKNGAWVRVRTYSGTVGPALSDEFPGQFHYLKFVSDSSIVRAGVSVDVQYR